MSSDLSPSLTVLLVEDEALIRMNCADMLQDAGHNVIEASSAEEALAMLDSGSIDVLLTDVNLPGMSGTELAETARRLKPDIGLVFATGDFEVTGAPGAVVLNKPYLAESLEAAVLEAVSTNRST
ncbi:hypothetical protein Sa4125_27910 [Aureimonas sp. SA4125]|uniref:response regulator n=1 Tax=Aureimonas sp. SA4125 TaxID=2826993 RepID=UPI001CC7092B|nr:response regulator [Aureimonas sp. SA4125]BDA85249.1 hypothetical protein Sa4125_27910 [Aureimonas sp. SA4125]